MAVKLLSENVDLLHGKWNKILEENRLLEKYYSVLLAKLINKDCWEYDSFEMCQVLDSILISEDGQITVRFLEGTEVDFMKLHLGFLYIVPSGSTNDSQQLFSKLFRSINYDGVSLSKEESRKALYYQNPAFSNFFEGKLDNGEYVLCNLSIAMGAVGSKSVDWLRYLSILSRYSVNAEEVLKGYRKESSREDFYTDYVAYIINLPLKGDNQMFDGVREKAPYKDGIWKKRYPILQKEIQRLQAHMYSPDKELFPSWIDADYWLFGLIYYVLFEGKTLTDGCEDRLKSSIQSKIKAAKNDSKHLDRPNQLSFLRKRLQQSLKIYKSNVS